MEAFELLLAVSVVYLIPTAVAIMRGHHNTLAVAAVNILFGWTLIGWGVALVMACTAVRRRQSELH